MLFLIIQTQNSSFTLKSVSTYFESLTKLKLSFLISDYLTDNHIKQIKNDIHLKLLLKSSIFLDLMKLYAPIIDNILKNELSCSTKKQEFLKSTNTSRNTKLVRICQFLHVVLLNKSSLRDQKMKLKLLETSNKKLISSHLSNKLFSPK
ncbi:unnamed protein product (macronuclear) [Paramecium tetraurelia]|uniref:Uncharacterized protein n=1 Tax=Paramecium tetraurelia TaxID=5888 RepID=A0CIQ5_PARTE|nr:uncharacterized protein GSPATT00007807001 [Paramecium tetraurelia]CAK70672.1 unnamed protein product [Paramecium tetraurelia]|eukprot:XP_001438069.1 hypothetical protein (macronuclear) [Paramecium tetraurelia strain d4-2]